MNSTRYYAYRLIPPRPSFHLDMSEEERAIMTRHVAYWTEQKDAGKVLIFGPVVNEAGSWGLGVIKVGDESEVAAMIDGDPAISSGLATMEVGAMPAVVLSDR
jgi:uncharacterized protein YciI